MSTNELPWIALARSMIGLHENTYATAHNPVILDMLKATGTFNGEAKAWYQNDEVPWCGLFVGYCLGKSDRYVIKDWYRAKEWLDGALMTKLSVPAYGCVTVYGREGGGHVNFTVGKDKAGNLMGLGGNQSNKVSIAAFQPSRAIGHFWPSTFAAGLIHKQVPLANRYALPLLASNGRPSTNEA